MLFEINVVDYNNPVLFSGFIVGYDIKKREIEAKDREQAEGFALLMGHEVVAENGEDVFAY